MMKWFTLAPGVYPSSFKFSKEYLWPGLSSKSKNTISLPDWSCARSLAGHWTQGVAVFY